MKKIIYTLILCSFMSFAFAQETINSNNQTMPSDAEIMEIISKFNFDESQKQVLFKETKKRLEEIYSGNTSLILEQDANSSVNSNTSKTTNSRKIDKEAFRSKSFKAQKQSR